MKNNSFKQLLIFIITSFCFLLIFCFSGYYYLEHHWIQENVSELYQYSQTLPDQLTNQIKSPYELQQSKNGRILYQTNKKMDLKETKEAQTVKKNNRYGYNVRTINSTPYLFVACQKKGTLIEIYHPLHWLKKFKESFYWLLGILIFIFISLCTFVMVKQHHLQKQGKEIAKKIQWMTHHPALAQTVFPKDILFEPMSSAANHLAQHLNEQTISIKENQRQFQALIQHLPVGLFVVNDKQELVLINPQAQQLLNCQVTPPLSYMEVFTQAKLIHYLQKALMKKQSLKKEISLRTIEGIEYKVELSLRYLESEQQESFLLATLYDVTELRRLEAMQQTFVGNVSHELKTPITSIIGFIETLLDGALEDRETAHYFLEIMQKDAKRLQQLIQEIILLSRTGNELTKEEYIPLDVKTTCQQWLDNYHTMITKKGLVTHLMCNENIVITTAPFYFDAILKNLIENAIVYNKDNGTIDLMIEQKENQVVITIKDTGIGMASTDLDRIFERFYRVDKARSRNLGGTGLGLAIVKHYAEIIDASITVTSQLGVGTTFTLTLPLHRS